MWKRIRNIFKANNEGQENPSILIQRAIHDMHLSIQDSNVAIKNAKASQYEIQKKLDQYRADAAQLQKEATELAKKKKEHETKQVLAQKELVDKQVAQYEALNNNIWQTINQLQYQQQQIKLKIDELQTKEVLLSAKLTNAKTQADITQQLSELNQITNFHFEQLEQDAQQMENMTIVLNSLQAGATEAEVDKILGQEQISKVAQLNSSFENLLSDIDKEEKERQRQIEEAKNKKVDLLFSQMKGGKEGNSSLRDNTQQKEEKVKINPDEFFKNTGNQVVKNTENVIENFFENTSKQIGGDVVSEDTDNGDSSEDTQKGNSDNSDSKKNLLDSFFSQTPEKQEPIKEDKQKLLDDFFK